MGDTRVSEEIPLRHSHAEAGYRDDPPAAQPPEDDATLDDDCEVLPGTGNVFRDLNVPHPDMRTLRSDLAAQIMIALDAEGLSTRAAQERTGINHAQFSRIRRCNLKGVTIDRLMIILDKLGYDVDVSIEVRKRVP